MLAWRIAVAVWMSQVSPHISPPCTLGLPQPLPSPLPSQHAFPPAVQPSRSAVESRRRPRRLGRWSIHHSTRYAPPAVGRRLHAPRASPFPVMISALGITVRAHKLCGDFAGTSLRKLAPSAPQSRGRWPPR